MTPQHKAELEEIVRRYVIPGKVKTYLEVGARNGISVDIIGSNMVPSGQIVALDLPGGLWGGKGTDTALKAVAARLRQSHKHTVDLVFGDSRDPKTVDRVNELAMPWNPPFDLVFIDAEHTYEAVQDDWQNYGKFGKVVIFDDIAQPPGTMKHFKPTHGGGEAEYGVSKLWAALKAEKSQWETHEIIAEGSDNGKGVLVWRDDADAIKLWNEQPREPVHTQAE